MSYEKFRAMEDNVKRFYKEDEHDYRSKFCRDRDRILYSKEFRRLSGKTQVFVSGFDAHMRTRLTHTLEVSQISETIARELGLNEVLCEAISLGHDVGHTPFGHAGERTLNFIMSGCDILKASKYEFSEGRKGFKHNWQSVRVVTELEKISNDFDGLNLTNYTIWGILNHSKLETNKCNQVNGKSSCGLYNQNKKCKLNNFDYKFYKDKYLKYNNSKYWTIEAEIVKYADEIAQRHHDIEDGLRAGIISVQEIIDQFRNEFLKYFDDVTKKELIELRKSECSSIFIAKLSKIIVNLYVNMFIDGFKTCLNIISDQYELHNSESFYKLKSKIFSGLKNGELLKINNEMNEFLKRDKKFQKYLSSRIINSHLAQSMDGKSTYIIRKLIKAYLTNPQQLPDNTILKIYGRYNKEKKLDTSADKKTVGEVRDKIKEFSYNNNKIYKHILLRTICDYIAGMTDKYALDQFNLLYGTKYLRSF